MTTTTCKGIAMKNQLSIGTKIYYTGDMANSEGVGIITKEHEATKYAPHCFDIEMEDGRKMRMIKPASFNAGPGQRFHVYETWKTEREAKIATYIARYKKDAAMRYLSADYR